VVRQLITRVLQAELPGVEVVGCGSGADAQQVLGEGVFDFITIALRLPDMDGLELARFVRESAPQAYVPIVVVSGDVDDRLHRRRWASMSPIISTSRWASRRWPSSSAAT
jgi:CheY-like chemotaxis protein